MEEYEKFEFITPNNVYDIDENKIKEFKNTIIWEELDKSFENVKNTNEVKNSLIEIVSRGDISKVKYDEEMGKLKEEDVISSDFLLIPLFLSIPFYKAITLIEQRYSNEDEIKKESNIKINNLLKDQKVDSLINSICESEEDVLNEVNSLKEIGKFALPKLKLKLTEKELSENELQILTSICLDIILGEKEGNDLYNKSLVDDESIREKYQKEIMDLINDIDMKEYIDRHPEEFKEFNLKIIETIIDDTVNLINNYVKEGDDTTGFATAYNIKNMGESVLPNLKNKFFDESLEDETRNIILFSILLIKFDKKTAIKIHEDGSNEKEKEKHSNALDIISLIIDEID